MVGNLKQTSDRVGEKDTEGPLSIPPFGSELTLDDLEDERDNAKVWLVCRLKLARRLEVEEDICRSNCCRLLADVLARRFLRPNTRKMIKP